LATLAAPGVSATARSRPDVTDHDLVQAVRAGDDHAFERLYHRYHRRISAYVFGMVHDHGRAEDLTQEVFVNALRRMRQTDRPIVFKPWIYEIAKNACIDAFRRSKRAEEVSIDAQDGHGLGPADHGKLHATGASPEAAIEGKQQLDHLCGAFGGLSDAHHQILVMRELQGLSYREIGERLGMSRPSVESTLFRARRRLTEEYEELRTGERCLRIQDIIGRGAEAGGRLGIRDQRRVSSHVTHCGPCRRQAVLAGLDAAILARRPVRAKIAALLPLPAFVRRRWFGGDGTDAAGAHAAHHGPALAQASMAAAQYGEQTMAGWMKATAVAAAVAVAGVGAGAADHAASGAGRHHDAPIVRGAGGSAAAPATAARSGAPTAAPAGRARHSVARTAGGGPGSHTSSAGAAAGAAKGRGTGGTFSGGGGSTTSGGSPASGGGGSSSPAARSGGGAPSGGSSPATSGTSTATKPAGALTGAVTGATGAVTGAAGAVTGAAGAVTEPAGTGSGSSAPLVQPDLTPLTQTAAGASPPQSAGAAVTTATDAVGGAVGGQVGGAVRQTGAAAGGTVDQVTQGVKDATGTLLGGGK
jgi:RNA polymerase sigma factor (sigma-70 family)